MTVAVAEIPVVKIIADSFLSVWVKGLLMLIVSPISVIASVAIELHVWIREHCHSKEASTQEVELETVDSEPAGLKIVDSELAEQIEKSGNIQQTSVARTFSILGLSQWPYAEVIDKGMLMGVVVVSIQVRWAHGRLKVSLA